MSLKGMAVSVLLTALAGCGTDSSREGREYMLEQASGVKLGMTLGEVRQARGEVIVDENGVWESLDRYRSTSFVFDATPGWHGSLNALKAVVVDRLVPVADTSVGRRTRDSIRGVWDRVAGPPEDSLQFWSPPTSPEGGNQTKLVFWCRPDALLLLLYEPDHRTPRGRLSLIRAIIQSPEFKLASGYGIPYHEVRCRPNTRSRRGFG